VFAGITDLLTSVGTTALPAPGSVHLFFSTFSYVTSPSKKMALNVEVPNGSASANTGSGVGPEAAGSNLIALGAATGGGSAIAIRFRAILIFAGLYTTAQRDALKTWATTYHGVTLL
jgi:hypothetical protein